MAASSLLAGLTAALVLLSGCAAPSSGLSTSPTAGANAYTPANSTIVEIPPDKRDAPVHFDGPLVTGGRIDSDTWQGSVVVVNFWYAACPPCRAEARDLQAVHTQFINERVEFIGVNVRDTAATAEAFEKEFGITYPSILDANTGAVQYAFAGKAAPNAVPTTIVLDQRGRMASRIVGRIPSRGTLAALIKTAMGEQEGR